MKTALGLAACVLLSSALTASADTAERPHFKPNGERCTAQEIASPPTVTFRYRGRDRVATIPCRTTAQWKLISATESQYERDLSRWKVDRLNDQGFVDMPKRPPAPF